MRATAAIIICCIVAGCASGERPPDVWLVEGVEWDIALPLVFVNVTVRNVANITLGPPVGLFPEVAVAFREVNTSGSSSFSTFSLSLSRGVDDEPPGDVYYPDDVRQYFDGAVARSIIDPVDVGPNASFRLTFAFLPKVAFGAADGHYQVTVQTTASVGGYVLGELYRAPCFNSDIPEYYGMNEVAGDCYDSAARRGSEIDNGRRIQDAQAGNLTGIDVAFWELHA